MKTKFTSQSTDPHFKKEEEQWAEILCKGNPYAGIILITSQKLCTTTHELQKAIDANQVTANQVVFYCSQLEYRIDKLLGILNDCGADFQATKKFEDFKKYIAKFKNDGQSYNLLKAVPEQVHVINHLLTDEVQKELNK